MTGMLGSFCRHKRMATSRVEVQKVVLGVEAVHNTRKKGKIHGLKSTASGHVE